MREHKKLRKLEDLILIISQNKNIVLTTGAFDVAHKGHIDYLKKAKTFGDKLIVILQSDELIKFRKGESRPIRNQKIRIKRLSYSNSYSSVDYIFLAEDLEEFYRVIDTLNPNVLIVSETTSDSDTCPERMINLFGGKMKVISLPAMSKIHSTDIIKNKKLIKPV